MPFLWLSLAFLAGILVGEYLNLSVLTWLILSSICLLFLLSRFVIKKFSVDWSPPRIKFLNISTPIVSPPIPYSVIILFLCFGALRYQTSQPKINPSFIAWYNDRNLNFVVEGILDKPPDVRDNYTNLTISAKQIKPMGDSPYREVSGSLLARVTSRDNWHYGDRVQIEGLLETPPEDEGFSYRQYLERKGVFSYMPIAEVTLVESNQGNWWLSWIYKLKERALNAVYTLYPDPEASLLAGILLGVESRIPEHVQEAFRDTGTSHIIAISGFNITIIAGLLATVAGRLLGRGRKGARWGALVALVGILIYTILVGAEAAVVRAAIMGGLTLLAMQLGRRQDGLNSLAIVAALMALIDPNVLWDVGFQLSFAATLGLVLLAEPFTNTFVNLASRRINIEIVQRFTGPVGEYLLFTLAASLFTLPIILYHFQRISLISLLANPLILPAQPPVMIMGGLAVILGMIYQPLGQLVAYLAWPFVVYTIRLVELLTKVPGASITVGRINLLVVAVFYAVVLMWILGGKRISTWFSSRRIEIPSKLWGILTVLLIVLTVFVWRVALSAPDNRLHMTVLDVGTGDAILIQAPTGRHLLIDGGSSATNLSDGLGRRLPITGRKLDFLLIGGIEDWHIGALPSTIERFPPAAVLWAGPRAANYEARTLIKKIIEMKVPVIQAEPGQVLDLGKGAGLKVLAVTERGAVYLLVWRDFQALLPIGLDFDTMEALQKDINLTEVTTLLLSESGYAPVNTDEWISRWKPRVILLSVGAGDRNGLPDLETLEAVNTYNLLRTDQNGWIDLSTDGEQLWISVEKR